MRRLDVDLGLVQQVPMKAGSVCVFTEALCQCVYYSACECRHELPNVFCNTACHVVFSGTLPWTSDDERRTLIYRFNPANLVGGKQTLDALRAVRTLPTV